MNRIKNDKLYKYSSINEKNFQYIEKIFTKNEFFFPSPSSFNDPFDCSANLSTKGSIKEHRNYYMNLLKKKKPHLNQTQRKRRWKSKGLKIAKRKKQQLIFNRSMLKLLQKTINNTGVFCLTESPDNILMWSHYAQNHEGLCFEFNFANTDSALWKARQVIYKKSYPDVNLFRDSASKQIEANLYTKSSHWSYEKEWRIVNMGKKPDTYSFPKPLLSGVILGCKMAKKDKEFIRSVIKKNNVAIDIFESKINRRQYKLDIIPAN